MKLRVFCAGSLLLAAALLSLPTRAQVPLSAVQTPQAKAQVAGDANTACNLPLDLCESAWSVAFFGNYSSINNAPTNNGFMTGAAFNVNKSWSAELRYYQTATPSGKLILPGAAYRFSAAHIFPQGTAYGGFDPQYLEFGVHANAGFGWSSGTGDTGLPLANQLKFAASVGGFADYTFPSAPNVQVRLLDVSYVYCPLFPSNGTFLGNHLALASGVKIVFGGNNAPASLRRFALVHKKTQ